MEDSWIESQSTEKRRQVDSFVASQSIVQNSWIPKPGDIVRSNGSLSYTSKGQQGIVVSSAPDGASVSVLFDLKEGKSMIVRFLSHSWGYHLKIIKRARTTTAGVNPGCPKVKR